MVTPDSAMLPAQGWGWALLAPLGSHNIIQPTCAGQSGGWLLRVGAGVQRGGQMPHQGRAGAGEGRAGFLHLLVTSPHVSPSSAQHPAVEEDAQ